VVEKERDEAARERSQAALNERLREENERLRILRERRRETRDRMGQTIIQEDNRTIYQTNNQYFIQHNEVERLQVYGGDYSSYRSPRGNTVSTIVRPDGYRIEVEVDSYGRPLRRVRIAPWGERYVLFENRPIEAGIGFAFGSFIVDLPPPEIDIPREQYIVDSEQASEDDIYNALQAPPVEPLERSYSLDEICASVHLRERMRSVNIDTIHFEFGSWEIGPDQAGRLESVAAVIKNIVSENPREVFLIEGHTDAVGSDLDNLSLSDRRAESVANLLSQQFGVPAENLVTRGYGKQFLLIPNDGPEWRNRRVVVRRITPLLSANGSVAAGGSYEGGDRYR
jgi:outer membrane protein OmpA-like peptidoglycan-associated protein